MAQQSTADLARAFTEAWTRHDMETAATYLADDVVFHGPQGQLTGKQAYLEGLTTFAQAVQGVRILGASGDEQQALILYELDTPNGITTCTEVLTFEDSKIVDDRFVPSTHPAQQG